MESSYVFVYGTLKTGEPNHYWFEDQSHGFSERVGEAVTSEKFPLVIATKYNLPMLLGKTKSMITRESLKYQKYLKCIEFFPTKPKSLKVVDLHTNRYFSKKTNKNHLDQAGTGRNIIGEVYRIDKEKLAHLGNFVVAIITYFFIIICIYFRYS